MKIKLYRWPEPYSFAFGITDDTDKSTTERVRKIYNYCIQLGIKPTRSVWVTKPKRTCGIVNKSTPDDSVTLEDPEYLKLCKELSDQGIEIALHGVSSGDNTREDVLNGLNKFNEELGNDPTSVFFHSHNAENAYWGKRFFKNQFAKMVVSVLVPHKTEEYLGHNQSSEYFCADILFSRIKYVRLFRTLNLNVLSINSHMPFHLPRKPLVRFWFCSTAEDLLACNKITPRSIDRVARQNGLIMLYCHMAEKFVTDDLEIHPQAASALSRIGARSDCWKAGVTEILNRCLVFKNLIITHRKNAVVISNPTNIPLNLLQLRSSEPSLYLESKEELRPNEQGIFVIPTIPPNSAVALYTTPNNAFIGDPVGIPRFQLSRMLFEEAKRLLLVRRFGISDHNKTTSTDTESNQDR